jgi:hypothetical protein
MNTKLGAIVLIGVGLIASVVSADARSRWNPIGKCYEPLERAATGKGILGLGSERAHSSANRPTADRMEGLRWARNRSAGIP